MTEALPRVIDSDSVLARVSPIALIDAMENKHLEEYETIGRLHTLISRDDRPSAELLIWAGARADGSMGAKIVSISPDNGELSKPSPTVHSAFALVDRVDGRFRSFIVGESFTRCKTAADSALAARYLAPVNPTKLVVLGAGAQARTHLTYLHAVCPTIERIDVWNRNRSRAEQLIEERFLPVNFQVSNDLEASVAGADIVVCLTSSPTPVLDGKWLKLGCHVDLVGGFTPDMREANDAAILRSSVFVDHLGLTAEHCGDIVQPLKNGTFTLSDIRGDLFDLCRKEVPGRRDPQEITLFKNGGGGHLDLMMAEWLSESFR
ncbi:ornithine cyclodeaminase [Caballeronia sp. LjRoot34]|uniref:ornithine cyclodeaminase family protein n=1 Tax=Caballeronia sp. LjRoot34 TaxID=3342325 RepID=UPI003ECD87B9